MNFSEALVEIKSGKSLCREGWNGKGMFVFLFDESFADFPKGGLLKPWKVEPSISIKTAQDTIVFGWKPSNTDMLAEDWNFYSE